MAERALDNPLSTELQAASPDRSDQVSRRAYDLYLARGGEHGRDLDDWTQAERELADGGDDRGSMES
jgi:hypothetical protein